MTDLLVGRAKLEGLTLSAFCGHVNSLFLSPEYKDFVDGGYIFIQSKMYSVIFLFITIGLC